MFTIYGGKAAFDQWDQGQRVACQGMKAGDKVTFTNCTGETHPMLSYTYEGIVVCDVPNDMLMMAVPILVDLCRSHEHRTRLLVNAKEKPEGYVYIDNTEFPQGSGGTSSGDGCDCDFRTPVKGVDYFTEADKEEMINDVLDALPDREFTEADKAEIVSDVLAALPTWEGGAY